MIKKKNKISIIKKDQSYLKKIFIKYPKINSGRKNHNFQYNRVLKNILLAKAYDLLTRRKERFELTKLIFKENSKSLTINFIKK
tara:strand:+ start:95 stop:346 length:252 start_codon:yes stop_codon:yes gene_type:complete